MNDPLKRLGWVLHGGGLAAVLSSACLVHWFVLRPLQAARAATLARHAEIAGLLEDVDQLHATRDRLKQDLAEAREQEKLLLSRVPDAPMEAAFLGQISRLADEVNLQIRDYRPGEVRTKPTYSEMQISLGCEGNYDSLCRFLDGLGQLPRLVNLSRLDVTALEGSDRYPATMKLVIYFSAGEKAASKERSVPHG